MFQEVYDVGFLGASTQHQNQATLATPELDKDIVYHRQYPKNDTKIIF